MEFTDWFQEEFDERKFILVLCRCSIRYKGRSRSNIGEGDRLILVKPDTTTLVHSTEGFRPVNWMKSPSNIIVESKDPIILKVKRTERPYEDMTIKIQQVYDHQSYEGLRDKKELDLTHTEKDMQEHLAQNPDLVNPKFRLKAREYPCPLGFLDLYGRIGDEYVVVELKAERAGLDAALQIKRYVNWLSENVEKARGILIAPGISPRAEHVLKKEGIEFKKMHVEEMGIRKKKLEKRLTEWF